MNRLSDYYKSATGRDKLSSEEIGFLIAIETILLEFEDRIKNMEARIEKL